jgi:hypothetical protein
MINFVLVTILKIPSVAHPKGCGYRVIGLAKRNTSAPFHSSPTLDDSFTSISYADRGWKSSSFPRRRKPVSSGHECETFEQQKALAVFHFGVKLEVGLLFSNAD